MPKLVDVTVPADQIEGTESVLSRWYVRPGEAIAEHQPLLELTTDKVTVEIAAPAGGVLVEQLKSKDEDVRPGDLVGRIDTSRGAAADAPQAAPRPAPEAAAPPRAPSPGRTAAPAPAAPLPPPFPAPPPPTRHAVPERTAAAAPAGLRLSPAVRKALRERGLHASQVEGTGRGGRITVRDVLSAAGGAPSAGMADLAASLSTTFEVPAEAPEGQRVPHSPMRSMIARHMVESALKTAPHVTALFEADLSGVLAHRARLKPELERHGVRLTLTAYFVAAAVEALRTVPEVNARWHDDALEFYDTFNIGIATALEPDGLIVPVIHGAEQYDLPALAARLGDLVGRARSGRLEPREVQHGTFTITNHGVGGSLVATPIINQPQSAILGLGKLEKRLVVVDQGGADAIAIRPRMYVTLTIDHRVLDGFKANRFLAAFVAALESRWS